MIVKSITTFFVLLFIFPAVSQAREVEIGIAAFSAKGNLPSADEIQNFEQNLGKPLATINWFLGFNADRAELPEFPLKELKEKIRPGIIPMLTFEPWGDTQDEDGNLVDPFRKLNSGEIDDYLKSFARSIKEYGLPLRLRFGHEMIQDDNSLTGFPKPQWYPWQDYPEAYKAAYIRVYSIFKAEGAYNVEFVWSPNFEPFYQNMLEKYYPGPQYVNWIGLDGYNWNGGNFDSVFEKIYKNIVNHPEVYGDKPIMLSEIGAGKMSDTKPFNKAEWITEAFRSIEMDYPRVKSFYWFNVKKERDWRLDETTESWQAFKDAMNSEIYLRK